MNDEKQYTSLELGETYKFAGYDWTVCKLYKEHNIAVIQSHGVTHGVYAERLITGCDISSYNDTMKSLYEDIKEVEDKSDIFGKGLYLVSNDLVGFTKFGECGSGYYWKVLKEVAKNASSFGAASNFAWIGADYFKDYALSVSAGGGIYYKYLPCEDYAIAPAFNLDVSKVDVVDNEIVIKGRGYAKTNTDKSLTVEKNVKKARLILAITEQVSENNFERHYKTVEIEVPESANLADYDIIGGEWIS